jgi:hypothetical protein
MLDYIGGGYRAWLQGGHRGEVRGDRDRLQGLRRQRVERRGEARRRRHGVGTRLQNIKDMPAIQSHRDLIVWQKAVALRRAHLPATEDFLRRAHWPGVPGKTRGCSTGKYCGAARTVVAQGLRAVPLHRERLLMEVETLLTIAQRLGYGKPPHVVPAGSDRRNQQDAHELRQRLFNPTGPATSSRVPPHPCSRPVRCPLCPCPLGPLSPVFPVPCNP